MTIFFLPSHTHLTQPHIRICPCKKVNKYQREYLFRNRTKNTIHLKTLKSVKTHQKNFLNKILVY